MQKVRNLNCRERGKADDVYIAAILEEQLWALFKSPYIFLSGAPLLLLGKGNLEVGLQILSWRHFP